MDRFTKFSLAFIAFSLPLQVFSIHVGFSILLIRVIFLISFCFYLIIGLEKGLIKIPRTFLDFNILFLIIVNFLITIFAIDIALSLKNALLHFFLIIFFYYIFIIIKSKEVLNFAINTYIFTALIIGLYGIFQQVGFLLGWNTNLPFIDFFTYHPEACKDPTSKFWAVTEISSYFTRIRGTFLDTNTFAGYIVSAFGLTVTKLIYVYSTQSQYKDRLKYLFLSIFFLITIFITMSRSALVGLFFLLLIVILYYRKDLFKNYVWLKLIYPSVILIGIILIIFPDLYDLFEGVLNSFFIDKKNTLRTKSTMLHLKIALEGVSMFLNNPLTGVGLYNFKISFAQNNMLWYSGITHKHMMAHSLFLTFFAEGGLIGALANYSLIGVIIFQVNKRIKSISNKKDKAMMIGLFCSYIGLLGSNIFYQYYHYEFIWFITALNVTGVYLLKKEYNEKPS